MLNGVVLVGYIRSLRTEGMPVARLWYRGSAAFRPVMVLTATVAAAAIPS